MSSGDIYIGLGSNLEDRERHIRGALREIAAHGDIRVLRISSMRETRPVGGPTGQGMYLNAAAELDTGLSPHELLDRLQEIERAHGRTRDVASGPRTLDLDLLIYRDAEIDDPKLTLPHPRMWERSFVLEPLSEICDLERIAAARRIRTPAHA